MHSYLHMVWLLLLAFGLLGCNEKIELDDSDSTGAGITLEIDSLGNDRYQLTWTRVNTQRFVKYVLLKSDMPIPDGVNPNAPGFSISQVRQWTSKDSVKCQIRTNLDDASATYYRVAVVLTDRSVLSTEQQTKSSATTSLPFTTNAILVNPDRTQMYLFSDVKDSIYLLDFSTFQIIKRVHMPDQLLTWCIGQRNGVQELYVKTNAKLLRFSNSNMAITLAVNNFDQYNQMLVVDQVIVALYGIFSEFRTINITTGATIDAYQIPFSIFTSTGQQLYSLDRTKRTFSLCSANTTAVFRLNATNSIQLIKSEQYQFNQFFSIPMKYLELEAPPYLPVSAEIFIDSSLTQVGTYDLNFPNVINIQALPTSRPENYLQTILSSSQNGLQLTLRHFDYATQNEVTPIQEILIQNSTSNLMFFFEQNGKVYWIRDNLTNNATLISTAPL